MKNIFLSLLGVVAVSAAVAQVSTFPVNGARDPRHTIYAFTNAHIQVDPENVIESGTMLVQDGRILAIGAAVIVPKEAVLYDLAGKFIYPSFIDPYTTYGMPQPARPNWSPNPQYDPARSGAFGWNDALKPEVNAAALFVSQAAAAEDFRTLGFGTVMMFARDGIARGTAGVVTLNSEDGDNAALLKEKAAACYSFDKGSSTQEYPSSLMGAIALLRQTYYDADWYRTAKNKTEYNLTLDSWNNNQALPSIFETTDKWNVLRADKVGDEFKVQYIFKGSGNEYQRMEEMKATGGSFILPLNFPEPYNLEDPYDAEMIDYADLKHWELAPLNPGAFEQYGIRFALTASDLKEKKDFFPRLRKAIEYGLTPKAALRALTITPAEMLGIQNEVGALKTGMLANFIITSGDIFAEGTIIHENWVRGRRYIMNDYTAIDIRGRYDLNIGSLTPGGMKIEGEVGKYKGMYLPSDSAKQSMIVSVSGTLVTLSFYSKVNDGVIRLSGNVNPESKFMNGRGQLPDGTWIDWMATQTQPFVPKVKTKDTTAKDIPTLDDVIYPFAAFGRTRQDTSLLNRLKHRYNAVLIRNATVWTNSGDKDSVLYNTDVYMVDGRIVRIGQGITPTKGAFALVIDGTGKHLTPGIIDEHSHIAVSGGVNEGTQASSAEVRIGDVINPDDVNIYRQLAGGVTAVQQLHGSANPIGGQSSLIKLRWGSNAEQMKIEKAPGFIKFALGENVKQANWGDNQTIRFPQTRMGVEQVYYDHFIRAKEYMAQWEAWKALPQKEREKVSPPRRDLELDALVEILLGTRFITCHSYVQSELNMLMHVSDSMGFHVNTFTHILEGYKVADKMKKHGIGASSFSDWWAYKYEVKDAIPYNAAILFRMGIITAINSDDAEMARRLNQEAAKSMKYGGLTEVQCMQMVTINPAKLLHLDHRMGQIKVGYDADLVLWSDNPTSVYSRVETTIVDGNVMYDSKEDEKIRKEQEEDRARITQKMIAEKNEGIPTRPVQVKKKKLWDCEDMERDENYLDDTE
jgi:imidazolonepropionase-like amidohydrolase